MYMILAGMIPSSTASLITTPPNTAISIVIAAERVHSYEDDYIPSLISDKPAVASSQKPYNLKLPKRKLSRESTPDVKRARDP